MREANIIGIIKRNTNYNNANINYVNQLTALIMSSLHTLVSSVTSNAQCPLKLSKRYAVRLYPFYT